MLSNIQAVIVDLDGTMVDTLGDFEVALNRTMADLGLPGVDRAAVERTVGKGSEHLIRSLLAEQLRRPEVIGCGEACPAMSVDALFDRAWRQYQHHYLSINGQFSDVFAGVEEGLRAMQAAGLGMACLTNKPLAFAQDLLKAKGLDGFFSTENRAMPHVRARGRWYPTKVAESYYHFSPAAGVNASAIDLGYWLIAQLGHNPAVLSDELLASITAKQVKTRRDLRRK